ncbi:hypothetical protein [Telluribacter humicola]|uniref:hypothetical protein n=1 Tax=Telluribacter humicola TaxID=1720261 RepID=UPI001A969D74|nr:hypothetical protein [Telluribacter humicola]
MILKPSYILTATKVLLTGGILAGLQAFTPADHVPLSHERTLDGMLKSYQRELNALVPSLNGTSSSKKAEEFVHVYFMDDTASIVNHIIPGNVKPDKSLEPLADKASLKVEEYLRLAGGLYKKGFKYELERDLLKIVTLDSTNSKDRFIHRYRLTVPVTVQGRPNAQLQVEVQDTLDIYASVYSDSKRNVRYARIQNIVRSGTSIPAAPVPAPKPESIPGNNDDVTLIDWPIERKIDAILKNLTVLKSNVSEEQFSQFKDEAEAIFGPSGYVNLVTKDGQTMRLPRVGFLMRVRDTKSSYELMQSTLVLYDQFRENSLGKWYCRSTTFHDVNHFDKGNPVPGKVTSAQRMPMLTKAPTQRGSYWQIVELTLKEK